MKGIFAEYEALLKTFDAFMSLLCSSMFAAEPFSVIFLVVKTLSDLRRSFIHSMLKRYLEPQDFISKLDKVELDEPMPIQADNRRIKSTMSSLFTL